MAFLKRLFLCLASSLALVSCSSASSSSPQSVLVSSEQGVETDKAKRYEFDLDSENYWRFLDLSITHTDQTVYYGIEVTITGVLSFAYYENVVVTFTFQASGTGGVGGTQETFTAVIKTELNAAGCFHRVYPYTYVPENVSPTFNRDNFYGYGRTMSLSSVSGKVLFAI